VKMRTPWRGPAFETDRLTVDCVSKRLDRVHFTQILCILKSDNPCGYALGRNHTTIFKLKSSVPASALQQSQN
jgi:hypothetical protein